MSHVPLPDELSEPERQLNPFPWFERMRESDPVRYDSSRETWDVFRYDHVSDVLSNHEVFSSDVMGEQAGPLAESMTFSDPPRHDFLREAAAPFFRPVVIDEYRSEVREQTTKRLDAATGQDYLDVMNDLGFPVAATTVGALLGVPDDDYDRFVEYASKALRGRTVEGEPIEDPRSYSGKLVEYFSELVEKRRANPQDGLVSHLLDAEVDGRTLTDEDIVANCQMMMVGSTSAAIMLTNAVYSFQQVEGLVPTLADDPDALDSAIEESLRYRSSTLALPRVATRDVELGGKQIQEGDRLTLWVASANRDETVFEDPDSFVADRAENDHLTFGEGLHYCIGTRVARMEARIILSELLGRLSDVEIRAEAVEPRINPVELGFESLPIRFGE